MHHEPDARLHVSCSSSPDDMIYIAGRIQIPHTLFKTVVPMPRHAAASSIGKWYTWKSEWYSRSNYKAFHHRQRQPHGKLQTCLSSSGSVLLPRRQPPTHLLQVRLLDPSDGCPHGGTGPILHGGTGPILIAFVVTIIILEAFVACQTKEIMVNTEFGRFTLEGVYSCCPESCCNIYSIPLDEKNQSSTC